MEFSNSSNMFFGENPNAGIRVRQSGNMGNDLFVKNRWIFGGVFRRDDGSVGAKTSGKSKGSKADEEETPSIEKKSSSGDGPSKKDAQDKKKKKKRKNLALM